MPTSADQPTNQPTNQPAESSHSRKFILNIDLQGMFIFTYSSHVLLKFCEHFILFFYHIWYMLRKTSVPLWWYPISWHTTHGLWTALNNGVSTIFSPGKEKLIFAWKRFLCRPLNPQFERIGMHGMFYPLGNIPIPAIRCSAIDKAIHPNGIWRQWGGGSG